VGGSHHDDVGVPTMTDIVPAVTLGDVETESAPLATMDSTLVPGTIPSVTLTMVPGRSAVGSEHCPALRLTAGGAVFGPATPVAVNVKGKAVVAILLGPGPLVVESNTLQVSKFTTSLV
jgi:hypothetical protein